MKVAEILACGQSNYGLSSQYVVGAGTCTCHVVLIGGPGAGKGTVSRGLCRRFALAHLSTGDVLRQHVQSGTALGLSVAHLVAGGQLVADEIIYGIVANQLQALSPVTGCIFDGVPRTHAQAVWLDSELERRRSRIACAIHIMVPSEELVVRAAERRVCSRADCQRSYGARSTAPRVEGICDDCGSTLVQRLDDRPEVVRRRLAASAQIESIAAEYYAQNDRLVVVDGAGLSMMDLTLLVESIAGAALAVCRD